MCFEEFIISLHDKDLTKFLKQLQVCMKKIHTFVWAPVFSFKLSETL